MFISALFIVAKIWKQRKCPSIDEWINKIHTHTMEYYSALKEKTTLPLVMAGMNLENMM